MSDSGPHESLETILQNATLSDDQRDQTIRFIYGKKLEQITFKDDLK